MKKSNKRAFTILELLVVIAIVAILAVITVPQFIGTIEKSRNSAELAEVANVTKAASLFYADKGYYPTMQGEQPTFGDPKNLKFGELYPTYLSSLPHFSFWWIDHRGKVFHTISGLGTVQEDRFVIDKSSKEEWEYIRYSANGEEQERVASGTILLSEGDYIVINDVKSRKEITTVTKAFTGPIMHPESPEYNANQKPRVEITTDLSNVDNYRTIYWEYKFIDKEDSNSSVVEWTLDGVVHTTAPNGKLDVGQHSISLRARDSGGLWSDLVTVEFIVSEHIASTIEFGLTGAEQTWQVPDGVTSITIECWGAQGGGSGSNMQYGGKGGYAKGSLAVTPGQTLYIYVGGQGGNSGGYNGGGDGGSSSSGYMTGGGASDVRTIGGEWENIDGLNSRLIVAGGGGGGYYTSVGTNKYYTYGGVGGGLEGGNGQALLSGSIGGLGGTQTSGGTEVGSRGTISPWLNAHGQFGKGGSMQKGSTGSPTIIAGGGGGWYGGGSGIGTYQYITGGGGSSYLGGVTDGETIAGVNVGNGKVVITY